MTPSLQHRLLYPLLWLWVGSAAMVAIAGFLLAGQATESAFDRILADDARALASQVHWSATGPVFALDAGTAASLVYDSLAPSHFTVRTQAGQVLVGDARLQPPAVPSRSPLDQPIFQNQRSPKGDLRVVGLRLGGTPQQEPVWVLVAEEQSKRQHLREALAKAIFLPATLIGFVILPLIFFGVRYGLTLASRTSDSVAARSLNDLSPLPIDDVPQELRPLVVRINDLLARLKATLAHERQFIAEAAHQLRTPVAGIRLLTQDLMRTGQRTPNAPADPEVLVELDAAAGRATHLVQQLLSLARAEAGAGGQRQQVDITVWTQSVAANWQRAAQDAGKTLVWSAPAAQTAELWVSVDPMVLQDALDNLIENALVHGGPHGEVRITTTGATVCIEVADDGPSLKEDTLQRMRQPFWRAGDAQRPGTGLGVSIAEKAAVAFGGHLDIGSGPAGTCTRLCLPLANAAQSLIPATPTGFKVF